MVLEWFSAVGQGIGALGSLAAAGVALWLGLNAHKRADAAQRDSAVSGASVVSSSIVWSNPRDDELFKLSGYRGDGVQIENHGGSPVFNPFIETVASNSNVEFPTVKRTNEQIEEVFENYRPPEIIKPGGCITLPVELRDESGRIVIEVECVPTISFRDTLGNKWKRTGTATPQHVEEPESTKPEWKHGSQPTRFSDGT